MGFWEILGGILLLISSIIIIFMVLVQDNKEQGLSAAIQGGSSESYFNKNAHRTKEARLTRLTRVCAIVFFIATILVNVFAIVEKNGNKKDSDIGASGNDSTIGISEMAE